MKLERASVLLFFSSSISDPQPSSKSVLYERLQQVPPSPEMQDRHALPPVHPSPGMPHQPPQQHHGIPPNHMSREMDRTPPDYIRTHGGTLRQEGRAGPIDSPMAPGALPHGPRRGSASGPEPRQLQFMQHLPPVQQDGHRGHAPIHSSPHMHHPNASHDRARSPSRSRGHPPPVYHPHPQQYPDIPQAQQHPLHSPPLSDRGHSRRHDIHELTASHGRHQNSIPPLSPSSDARTTRIHNHQRLGPGTYINRDEMAERERERDWERERERGRPRDTHMRTPPIVHRPRPATDRTEYPDPHASRRRDDQSYFTERRAYSRSNSVGSASGSEPPSRPDSRTQLYDADRSRAYRLRPVTQTEEVDFVHEDGRPQSRDRNGGGGGGYVPEQSRPPLDSRKRSRNDMDVDDADDGPPGPMYSRHSDSESRGSKRYHQA